MKKFLILFLTLINLTTLSSQINTDRVTLIGRNALYFEDYVLAIQYFNQVIKSKPYLAEPYYYRAIAKYYLEDFKGADDDCTLCIERNPFLTGAYQLRADARQNQKNYDGAEEDYLISLKENPNDKFILINLGIVNIENKDYDKAKNFLDELLKIHPSYTQGLLTRSTLFLETKDTINAIADIDLAIEKDKYFAPSYSMRAGINLMQKEYDNAVTDYDEAIKLDPIATTNYINRGLARYYKNDLRGAMSDYDHVLKIEPSSLFARFNRALLRAQVGDDNRAIEDFDFVIEREPDNYIAYMNRALLKSNIHDLKGALADLNVVLKEYPDFYQGYQLRSDIKRQQNDLKNAEQDYYHARNLEEKSRRDALSGKADKKQTDDKTREESDKTIDKFNLLVVADKEEEVEKSKYTSETRGKVQNKQANVELLPLYVATYYEKENGGLQNFIYFSNELDELNRKGILSRKLVITNNEAALDTTQIAMHFSSINEYSKLINDEPGNAIYHFARGLDYMLVQDYSSAIEDFTKATAIDPNFSLAYFNLAAAYTKQLKSKLSVPELYRQDTPNEFTMNMSLGGTKSATSTASIDNTPKPLTSKLDYDQIMASYDKLAELSPNFVFSYYNKAEVKSMQNDYRGAILDYNEALRRNKDFGSAYYNRGINRLRVKDTERGLEDLRKAGELGIMEAYSIIKRMTE